MATELAFARVADSFSYGFLEILKANAMKITFWVVLRMKGANVTECLWVSILFVFMGVISLHQDLRATLLRDIGVLTVDLVAEVNIHRSVLAQATGKGIAREVTGDLGEGAFELVAFECPDLLVMVV